MESPVDRVGIDVPHAGEPTSRLKTGAQGGFPWGVDKSCDGFQETDWGDSGFGSGARPLNGFRRMSRSISTRPAYGHHQSRQNYLRKLQIDGSPPSKHDQRSPGTIPPPPPVLPFHGGRTPATSGTVLSGTQSHYPNSFWIPYSRSLVAEPVSTAPPPMSCSMPSSSFAHLKRASRLSGDGKNYEISVDSLFAAASPQHQPQQSYNSHRRLHSHLDEGDRHLAGNDRNPFSSVTQKLRKLVHGPVRLQTVDGARFSLPVFRGSGPERKTAIPVASGTTVHFGRTESEEGVSNHVFWRSLRTSAAPPENDESDSGGGEGYVNSSGGYSPAIVCRHGSGGHHQHPRTHGPSPNHHSSRGRRANYSDVSSRRGNQLREESARQLGGWLNGRRLHGSRVASPVPPPPPEPADTEVPCRDENRPAPRLASPPCQRSSQQRSNSNYERPLPEENGTSDPLCIRADRVQPRASPAPLPSSCGWRRRSRNCGTPSPRQHSRKDELLFEALHTNGHNHLAFPSTSSIEMKKTGAVDDSTFQSNFSGGSAGLHSAAWTAGPTSGGCSTLLEENGVFSLLDILKWGGEISQTSVADGNGADQISACRRATPDDANDATAGPAEDLESFQRSSASSATDGTVSQRGEETGILVERRALVMIGSQYTQRNHAHDYHLQAEELTTAAEQERCNGSSCSPHLSDSLQQRADEERDAIDRQTTLEGGAGRPRDSRRCRLTVQPTIAACDEKSRSGGAADDGDGGTCDAVLLRGITESGRSSSCAASARSRRTYGSDGREGRQNGNARQGDSLPAGDRRRAAVGLEGVLLGNGGSGASSRGSSSGRRDDNHRRRTSSSGRGREGGQGRRIVWKPRGRNVLLADGVAERWHLQHASKGLRGTSTTESRGSCDATHRGNNDFGYAYVDNDDNADRDMDSYASSMQRKRVISFEISGSSKLNNTEETNFTDVDEVRQSASEILAVVRGGSADNGGGRRASRVELPLPLAAEERATGDDLLLHAESGDVKREHNIPFTEIEKSSLEEHETHAMGISYDGVIVRSSGVEGGASTSAVIMDEAPESAEQQPRASAVAEGNLDLDTSAGALPKIAATNGPPAKIETEFSDAQRQTSEGGNCQRQEGSGTGSSKPLRRRNRRRSVTAAYLRNVGGGQGRRQSGSKINCDAWKLFGNSSGGGGTVSNFRGGVAGELAVSRFAKFAGPRGSARPGTAATPVVQIGAKEADTTQAKPSVVVASGESTQAAAALALDVDAEHPRAKSEEAVHRGRAVVAREDALPRKTLSAGGHGLSSAGAKVSISAARSASTTTSPGAESGEKIQGGTSPCSQEAVEEPRVSGSEEAGQRQLPSCGEEITRLLPRAGPPSSSTTLNEEIPGGEVGGHEVVADDEPSIAESPFEASIHGALQFWVADEGFHAKLALAVADFRWWLAVHEIQAQAEVFGSSASGFADRHSDVDVSLPLYTLEGCRHPAFLQQQRHVEGALRSGKHRPHPAAFLNILYEILRQSPGHVSVPAPPPTSTPFGLEDGRQRPAGRHHLRSHRPSSPPTAAVTLNPHAAHFSSPTHHHHPQRHFQKSNLTPDCQCRHRQGNGVPHHHHTCEYSDISPTHHLSTPSTSESQLHSPLNNSIAQFNDPGALGFGGVADGLLNLSQPIASPSHGAYLPPFDFQHRNGDPRLQEHLQHGGPNTRAGSYGRRVRGANEGSSIECRGGGVPLGMLNDSSSSPIASGTRQHHGGDPPYTSTPHCDLPPHHQHHHHAGEVYDLGGGHPTMGYLQQHPRMMDAANQHNLHSKGSARPDTGLTKLFECRKDITSAIVPIIKIVHVPTGVPLDISAQTPHACATSRLLRGLAASDYRLRDIVVLTKIWAKHRGICNNRPHYPTTYAYSLCAVAFLQSLRVLPLVDSSLSLVAPTRLPSSANESPSNFCAFSPSTSVGATLDSAGGDLSSPRYLVSRVVQPGYEVAGKSAGTVPHASLKSRFTRPVTAMSATRFVPTKSLRGSNSSFSDFQPDSGSFTSHKKVDSRGAVVEGNCQIAAPPSNEPSPPPMNGTLGDTDQNRATATSSKAVSDLRHHPTGAAATDLEYSEQNMAALVTRLTELLEGSSAGTANVATSESCFVKPTEDERGAASGKAPSVGGATLETRKTESPTVAAPGVHGEANGDSGGQSSALLAERSATFLEENARCDRRMQVACDEVAMNCLRKAKDEPLNWKVTSELQAAAQHMSSGALFKLFLLYLRNHLRKTLDITSYEVPDSKGVCFDIRNPITGTRACKPLDAVHEQTMIIELDRALEISRCPTIAFDDLCGRSHWLLRPSGLEPPGNQDSPTAAWQPHSDAQWRKKPTGMQGPFPGGAVSAPPQQSQGHLQVTHPRHQNSLSKNSTANQQPYNQDRQNRRSDRVVPGEPLRPPAGQRHDRVGIDDCLQQHSGGALLPFQYHHQHHHELQGPLPHFAKCGGVSHTAINDSNIRRAVQVDPVATVPDIQRPAAADQLLLPARHVNSLGASPHAGRCKFSGSIGRRPRDPAFEAFLVLTVFKIRKSRASTLACLKYVRRGELCPWRVAYCGLDSAASAAGYLRLPRRLWRFGAMLRTCKWRESERRRRATFRGWRRGAAGSEELEGARRRRVVVLLHLARPNTTPQRNASGSASEATRRETADSFASKEGAKKNQWGARPVELRPLVEQDGRDRSGTQLLESHPDKVRTCKRRMRKRRKQLMNRAGSPPRGTGGYQGNSSVVAQIVCRDDGELQQKAERRLRVETAPGEADGCRRHHGLMEEESDKQSFSAVQRNSASTTAGIERQHTLVPSPSSSGEEIEDLGRRASTGDVDTIAVGSDSSEAAEVPPREALLDDFPEHSTDAKRSEQRASQRTESRKRKQREKEGVVSEDSTAPTSPRGDEQRNRQIQYFWLEGGCGIPDSGIAQGKQLVMPPATPEPPGGTSSSQDEFLDSLVAADSLPASSACSLSSSSPLRSDVPDSAACRLPTASVEIDIESAGTPDGATDINSKSARGRHLPGGLVPFEEELLEIPPFHRQWHPPSTNHGSGRGSRVAPARTRNRSFSFVEPLRHFAATTEDWNSAGGGATASRDPSSGRSAPVVQETSPDFTPDDSQDDDEEGRHPVAGMGRHADFRCGSADGYRDDLSEEEFGDFHPHFRHHHHHHPPFPFHHRGPHHHGGRGYPPPPFGPPFHPPPPHHHHRPPPPHHFFPPPHHFHHRPPFLHPRGPPFHRPRGRGFCRRMFHIHLREALLAEEEVQTEGPLPEACELLHSRRRPHASDEQPTNDPFLGGRTHYDAYSLHERGRAGTDASHNGELYDNLANSPHAQPTESQDAAGEIGDQIWLDGDGFDGEEDRPERQRNVDEFFQNLHHQRGLRMHHHFLHKGPRHHSRRRFHRGPHHGAVKGHGGPRGGPRRGGSRMPISRELPPCAATYWQPNF